MSQSDRLPLGQQMLRGAGIGQAIVAFPICLFLGASAYYVMLEQRSHWLVYYFFRDSVSAIMAAGIIFSVYVQRKAVISLYQYLLFEAAKSLLATGLWLWLILDAAYGPWQDECKSNPYVRPCDVSARVSRAALASVVLL
ncbi:uncharacterized protein N0V89_008165 [Didymosphaeria variabile]|uniref:Uncharacterized protein n=1 Tax=Didymosphaeria variabile TaxID=1932322 RepID=A0A9W9C8B4_9PLEO|nr:uncharacterized protein N0V89_008165 [Didymosphaeria variabile]KAJ4349549.1 hypothetical protein N0V89_008165 [Didymosphaeria variabile]